MCRVPCLAYVFFPGCVTPCRARVASSDHQAGSQHAPHARPSKQAAAARLDQSMAPLPSDTAQDSGNLTARTTEESIGTRNPKNPHQTSPKPGETLIKQNRPSQLYPSSNSGSMADS